MRLSKRLQLMFMAVALSLGAGAKPARACTSGATAQEIAVQALYGGCWRDLYLWVWNAYQLTDDSWSPAGLSDACNISLPFAKTVNAVFMINYTLSDDANRQWHSSEDYGSSSRAGDNRFHGPFYMRFIERRGSAEATSETGRFAARDRTDLHCPLFDAAGESDDPVNRASVLVHESWHHWQRKNGFSTEHMKGPTGACTSNLKACDWYYFHTVDAFEFGQLERYSTSAAHFQFHSPYQIQAEFEADVAELAQPWVPVGVAQRARSDGNEKLGNAFVNRVAYRIGDPRPFAAAPVGSSPDPCYTACHQDCGCSDLTGVAKGACLRQCAVDCREGCARP